MTREAAGRSTEPRDTFDLEGPHGPAYRATALKCAIDALIHGAPGEVPRDVFLDICNLAAALYGEEVVSRPPPSLFDEAATDLLANPGAPHLLAFTLFALNRYRQTAGQLAKPSTTEVRAALADAFCITGPHRRPSDLDARTIKTLRAFVAAAYSLDERYRPTGGKSTATYKDVYQAGLAAAYKARFGIDFIPGDSTKNNLREIRELLTAHGYLPPEGVLP